jgi:uncharacterized glyoxalase superfamily protein PhnB
MGDKALITCLWFDTEGEEAAKHYTSIFKDSKLGRIVPYGEAGRRDAEMTMLIEFELNGQRFIALTAARSSSTARRSRSRSPARTKRRSTTTGTASPSAARRAPAAGSGTSSECPGRLSLPG